MKKLTRLFLSLAAGLMVFTSCSDQNEGLAPSNDAAGKGKPTGQYNAASVSSSLDGYTLTITIDQSGKQQVSHVLLQLEACDGTLVDANNVVSSTPDVDYTTGNGTGCHFGEGSFIKFDNLNFSGLVTLTITFNTQILGGNILVKSGQNCFGPIALDFDDNCGEEPEGKTETAFAMGDPNQCFSDFGFSRWGWTNGPIGEGNYSWPIYAGAGQCDISKGTEVGTLTVEYWAGEAVVTYVLAGDYTLDETHLYVGSAPLPMKNGKNTVAPGQYPDKGTSNSYTVSGLSGDIYVVAHAVVGNI